MSKLEKEKTSQINILTFLKFVLMMLLWTETDYDFVQGNEMDQRSYSFEVYGMMIFFVIAIESQFVKTIAILFSLLYTLLRQPKFKNPTEIIGSTKIILGHIFIQLFYFYHLYSMPKTKMEQKSLNESPLLSQRVGLTVTQRENTDTQNKKINFQEVVAQELDNEKAISNQEEVFEMLLTGFQCGIYILETAKQPVRIINSFMSHIVLTDEQLNSDLMQLELEPQLYNFTLFPQKQRHQSFRRIHINIRVCLYSYYWTQNICFENIPSIEKKEVQLFYRKMQMKTLIEHLLAFSHIKFALIKQTLDFSLKIYLKKDKLYTQVILNPIVLANKPQIAIYIQDLTEEPFILQLQQYIRNGDELIQTISQKIKEPLNCTLSMLELVQKEVNQELQTKYIDPALAGCKLLISTASDIQDYVTLHKNNKLEKSLMDIHTKEFISDCLNIIKSQALFRGLSIQVNIKQNVPIFLKTDPNRLRQIILNLLVKSIQLTINGFIEIGCQKSPLLADHIEILIKVMAQNVNESILESIELTLKLYLILKQLIWLQHPNNFVFPSQQHFISPQPQQLCHLNLIWLRQKDGTQFYFVLLIKNENPNFSQQLSQKRQSALIANKQQFQQVFGQNNLYRRHQSQRLTEISRLQIQKKLEKIKRESQIETTIDMRESILPQFGQSDASDQQQPKKSYSVSQISEQDDSKSSSPDSKNEFNDHEQFEVEIFSSKSSLYLNDKIENIEKQQQPQQFFDTILQLKEPKARKISVSMIQTRLNQQIQQQQLSSSQRDSLLTFGGRSSVYSSMRVSSINLGPNELLDCFEKMERVKNQQFIYKCQCPKILICEQNDFDLYAISHQLSNLKIPYVYTMQRVHIVELLRKQFSQFKTCCKGYHVVFIGVEYVNEQLAADCTKIKAVLQEFQKDTIIIGLIGFQGEDFRATIKKLPFHDCLSKPIMIDALLFIIAKWVRL
ncbi:unnamed protein product (macronuclear) [Paramecium tetraurelia]|uniref:Response regulatory domain-containing protein n=1 Tax=Paramecium tetraurelia TaxID=5888 RepID=A0D599_PARTE|nr:uncharacterized protein GSPATT00013663001 [Paramecium tetraurelia]CAK78216.1 unnamed protein product [Paramecium tetraurelia]|eukprot:XP_001445613.1 hypothetical protein (macronuclear) [Paramecium tetraurelia strain d4-2]